MTKNINTFWKEFSSNVGPILVACAVFAVVYTIPYLTYFLRA